MLFSHTYFLCLDKSIMGYFTAQLFGDSGRKNSSIAKGTMVSFLGTTLIQLTNALLYMGSIAIPWSSHAVRRFDAYNLTPGDNW